jgi:diguanylate cyclase (GGDEF)-like protein
MFDIDNFKEVNDKFGHPAGDTVLKVLVETVQEQIRVADILFRWGG